MIIPAILTDDPGAFRTMIETVAGFAPEAQLDFMDGIFVPSVSVPVSSVRNIDVVDAHLMVLEPERYSEDLRGKVRRVIVHVEALDDVSTTVRMFVESGLSIGLAINPDTPSDTVIPVLEHLDEVLFLSVYPGYYGRPLVPEALEKARSFKERYPLVTVGIDGGVKLENVREIAATGADRIYVGSAIFLASDPAEAFQAFCDAIL